jgi:hypothetical protein
MAAFWVTTQMKMPQPIDTAVRIILGILFIMLILNVAGIALP